MGIIGYNLLYFIPDIAYHVRQKSLVSNFVRENRRAAGLTQTELAAKAGVGLRFVRDLEQGKQSLRTDTVNKVLTLFGKCLGPVDMPRE